MGWKVKIADRQLSDSETKLWQLAKNMLRKDWTGCEKWVACTANVDHEYRLGGELAEHLHVEPRRIIRLLSSSKCVGPIQDALKNGRIGISDSCR